MQQKAAQQMHLISQITALVSSVKTPLSVHFFRVYFSGCRAEEKVRVASCSAYQDEHGPDKGWFRNIYLTIIDPLCM